METTPTELAAIAELYAAHIYVTSHPTSMSNKLTNLFLVCLFHFEGVRLVFNQSRMARKLWVGNAHPLWTQSMCILELFRVNILGSRKT